ncbi:MAG: hypothetical protein O7B99_15010 [Planctomycetota bacterium]|nr:hypothetical protein [Planctomycetota bacterium]
MDRTLAWLSLLIATSYWWLPAAREIVADILAVERRGRESSLLGEELPPRPQRERRRLFDEGSLWRRKPTTNREWSAWRTSSRPRRKTF